MFWMSGFVLMGHRMMAKAAAMPSMSSMSSLSVEQHIAELEQRIDRLVVLSEAMWEILSANGHTDEELMAKIEEIERRAAESATRVISCRTCGARLLPADERCQTCGATGPAATSGDPFDGFDQN